MIDDAVQKTVEIPDFSPYSSDQLSALVNAATAGAVAHYFAHYEEDHFRVFVRRRDNDNQTNSGMIDHHYGIEASLSFLFVEFRAKCLR